MTVSKLMAATSNQIQGSNIGERLMGSGSGDRIFAAGGDDLVYARAGHDIVHGGVGFDVLFGEFGNDRLHGGRDGDFVYGGMGYDILYGDSGPSTAKGTDLSADRLDGGRGHDRLVQGDGNDVMTGGAGNDHFVFRWQDPMVAMAVGTGRAFTSITDFGTGDDRLVFDVAGVGYDRAGANFVDGGAGDGTAGGAAASFYSGAASGSNGEAVIVLTEQGFASGADAVLAAQGEEAGDFVVYFNSTVGVASLLFVDGPDAAHSIARFTGINSIEELQSTGLSANDFTFA